jgi:UDP-N-acetylglucosamine 4,6-dehydratase
MDGTTHVIHTAAMKQVPACEKHPLEAIKTNINGSQNVLTAALSCRSVKKVLSISTDKAVYPINLYGVTKAAMEKLFINGNIYSRGPEREPKFSCCRYGNVLGSRGSVIPLFQKQYKEKKSITITDKEMTRFWISLSQVAMFIIKSLYAMEGGEIFVPHMPSCKITDLVQMLFPGTKMKEIGIRPGEKVHETLISEEESIKAAPFFQGFNINEIHPLPTRPFVYTSQNNAWELTKEELNDMMGKEI